VDEEKSLWPGRIGLLFAVVIATGCSLWLLPDAIRQHASELHAGDYAGIAKTMAEYLAAILAITFLVLYVLFLRGANADRVLVYLLIIVVVAADVDAGIVFATAKAGHEQSFQYRQAVADVRNLVDQLSTPADTAETLQARAANDARIAATISRDETARINILRASYKSEASTFILEGTLGPNSLATDAGIKAAHARIAQLRASIKKYRAEEQQIFADTRLAVQRAPIEDSVRPQMLTAFDRSLRRRADISQKSWDCEDQILAESDQMVRDLAHSQSDWHPQGNIFRFTSHHDLNTYRTHVEKIGEITQTEHVLQAQFPDITVTTVQYGPTNTN
jgi:hypothetical protein